MSTLGLHGKMGQRKNSTGSFSSRTWPWGQCRS